MATRKTNTFLPTVFQTDTNKKFLNATLDQLVTDPKLETLYGYIGRKFAPTYQTGDSYVIETTKTRQDYQLEPSVVIKDSQNEVTFFADYKDLLDKIEFYGGLSNNHSRLFSQEYYSFDPKISYDKLINFSQYYWLPAGPDPVEVTTTGLDLQITYEVVRDPSNGRYVFKNNGVVDNTITLARGGVYEFVVNQPGYPFWIQSEIGTSGQISATPTLSSRDIEGVTNNGIDQGTIVFRVPPVTAQDRFINMPSVFNVDYAFSTLPYSALANKTVSQFLADYPQYAGVASQLNSKHAIFVLSDAWNNLGDSAWTNPDVKDNNGNVISGYDAGVLVSEEYQYGVWRIVFIDAGITNSDGSNDPLIKLVHAQDIGINEKVYTRYGIVNANKEFYKDYDGFFKQVPTITATLGQLWIQDGLRGDIYSSVKVVEYIGWSIDVDTDILGEHNYTSPNGVEFTSGLKVQFGDDVTPAKYQNRQFYVEQVGDQQGIVLVPVDELVTPEEYNNEILTNYSGEYFPDYITINRGSADRNAWSRNNRWFHVDVITATAAYNKVQPTFANGVRGQRPIVQFDSNMQLMNEGRIGKKPINILDTSIKDAFGELQGKTYTTVFGIEIIDSNGDPIYPNGLRVIFGADSDQLVKNKIYDLVLVQYNADDQGNPTGQYYIELSLADDGEVNPHSTTVVTLGQHKGTQWWFDGINWNRSQQKTYLQQAPLFDVLDSTGKSYSAYTRSSFNGTRIFGYDRATSGVADPILNRGPVAPTYTADGKKVEKFYLSYKNFQTQGDIKFSNYFNTDTFTYVESDGTVITKKVNLGYLQKIIDATTTKPNNTWLTVPEESKQYQLFSYIFTGSNNPVTIDVTPVDDAGNTPHVKVFHNVKYIEETEWDINGNEITINIPLEVNDRIDILVYSNEVSKSAFYDIPENLDLNAQNVDIATLTLGQLRNHLVALSENSTIVEGNVLAKSNLRDISIKQQGGTILQHSAPIPYASIFLIDQQANFINSLRYAQAEYTRFKNKFLDLSLSLPGIDPTDPVGSVDTILTKINFVKNKSFPWYYSDMVPYGTLKNIVGQIGNIDGLQVFDPLKTNYEITEVFNDKQLSNKAVLIYLNDQQLINGVDYTFNKETPSVDFLISLAVGDILKIVEYGNTDGNYIPETPSKLGLWPSFVPIRFYDYTYRNPTYVIRGHDGSITPSFNDYRDEFLLELEKRIYNNIKLPNKNTFGAIYSTVPGKFRSGDYKLAEFNQILSNSFLSWLGNNKLDYSTNSTFEPNDLFTWNYSTSYDKIDGEQLPGSWRACYMYFYDTYRPNITPWEMLGFSSQPSWWEAYYGTAPYTGANRVLWDDLETGYIRFGNRQGIDLNYARPGLSNIIPVDANGNLIPPASVLAKTFNNRRAASAWAIGQQGPVEFAWRTSSDFPFAMQQAMALAKPAKYFGNLIDIDSYTEINPLYNKTVDEQGIIQVDQQYLKIETNGHITQNSIKFNGLINGSGVYRGAGYLNWISDYLINQGIKSDTYLLGLLTNFQVNLAYKVSGFTDQKYLKVLAEQVSPTSTNESVLIPNENYRVHLNTKPVPVDKITYSAVIIEKTTNGYSVRGYDLFNSYFTIIPSIVNNNANRITVLNSSATIYKDYQNLKMNVPYGYEFNSQQQIVDFLISYERYLIAQGFTFKNTEPQLQQIKDWTLSVREFMYWAQQGWKPGSILVISPVSDTLHAITSGAIIEGIEDNQYGTKVIDQNFNLIKNNKYTVYRTPTEFKLTLGNEASVIGYVELNLVRYEHALIFDNTTVFDDVIYQPESGNRQYRLKLIGQRTADWDGSLSPAGFVYNSGVVAEWNQGRDYLQGDLVRYKDRFYTALHNTPASTTFQFQHWQIIPTGEIQKGLLPNFATLAVESQSYYDSYGELQNKEQLEYSHALIGFKQRQFMEDLGLTETSQIEFYKGYIAQKGTKNAVDAFTSANINNITSSISMYEEWAMRVGDYGALTSNPFVEIVLDEKTFGINPGVAQFLDYTDNNNANGLNLFNFSQVYKLSGEYSANIALNRNSTSDYNNDIPTAGYVNIDDVDLQIFDLSTYVDLNNNIADMGSGYLIWVAKDFKQDWNVFRVTETNNQVITVENNLNNQIVFTTGAPHNLSAESIILVKDFDPVFNGFYRVIRVLSSTQLLVQYRTNIENFTTQEGNGILFRLDSVRFQYMEDARIYGLENPPNGWKIGDKIWIDDDAETTAVQGQPFGTQSSDTWKVYEKNAPWGLDQQISKGAYIPGDAYGTSVKMSSDNLILVVGAPGAENGGQVNTFVRDYNSEYQQGFNINPSGANTKAFGHTVDLATKAIGDTVMAVGAHLSGDNEFISNGYVYIYNRSLNSQTFDRSQVLMGDTAGDQFGYSLAFNQTGEWLYVGAPGNNTVYAYGLRRSTPEVQQIESINNLNTMKLNIGDPLGVINQWDTIVQVDTGAKATVLAVSNTGIQVDSITNFTLVNTIVDGTSGNVTIGNVTICANLNIISGGNLTVSNIYPLSTSTSVPNRNEVILNFTPVENDPGCLIVTDNEKTYLPGNEYTLNGTTLTFAANVAATTLTIRQQPYYKLIAKLPIPSGYSSAEYGYAVSTSFDGAQVAIGAPGDEVANKNGIMQAGAGAVYVWDRVIEAFNSVTDAVPGTGGQDYQTINDIAFVHKVTIDGIESTDYSVIGDNIIRFNSPPAIGQVIFVEVNQFNLLERIVGVDNLEGMLDAIQPNARFGTSLTICSNNCAIYIGAPNYNNGRDYNSGAVWKFHNKGRLYGTNKGYAQNPAFEPLSSIRLNNFEVQASLGLSGEVIVNAGDYIAQPSTGANVQVINGTVGNSIRVSAYLTSDVFTVGGNITINGSWLASNVSVRQTTLDEVVNDINNANILGVTATNDNGNLRVDSDVTVAKDQLRILSGTTPSGSESILTKSKLIVFAFMQIIVNPFGLPGEYFGNKVKLAANAYMLVISSARGTTFRNTTFDESTTQLDNDTTRFQDSIMSSGSVYIYELYDDPRNEVEHPGRYAYAQQLDPGTLVPGGEFGYALDIEGSYITIAAPSMTSSGATEGSGAVYVFSNPTQTRGWKLIRYEQPKVDLDSVTRAYLYNRNTNLIKENLQFIDPVKGRILGQAEQEISFKTEYDPAVYNRGFREASNINSKIYWGDMQVGKVWWNLSKVRFIDYEQDSLVYRSLNWGRMFEGSTVEICEWVKSAYLPSDYVTSGGNGVPVYPDNSAYVEQIYVDPATNIITVRYYYWVTNKTTVDPNNESRKLPTNAIADFIANPKNQNSPYAAIIRSNAIAFYNVAKYLSADSTVMHLDYQLAINTDIIHSEYELVQKGNPASVVPISLVNKMIDSLSGIDSTGALVPDPNLSTSSRHGISMRPRQGMFVDRLKAINELISYVNIVFAKNPIAEQFNLAGFNSEEPAPSLKLGEYNQAVSTEVELSYIDTVPLDPGYRVLVNFDTAQNGLWILYELTEKKTWSIARVQSYKTSLYWNYIDWYADGYSESTKPDFSVVSSNDALKLNAFEGTIVFIQNATGNNTWQLVEVQSDGSLRVIGIQNGTLQLSPSIGNYNEYEIGFGNQDFDSNRFDQNPNNEVRAIITALYNDIFVNTLQGEFNNLFFVMINYLLTEQNYVDWMFKSSFISITHKLRTLSQFPSFVVDNQTYYENYINEVKPYRTKIREYLLNYNGDDQFEGDITDFDLPAYFDTTYNRGIFRSPSGERPYVEQDEARWQVWPWNQWYNNRSLELLEVLVEHAGANYTLPPVVTITSTDGNGAGATAEAIIDGNTRSITSIRVTNSGTGYTSTPSVTINGNGTGASAYAVMHNPTVRTFDSKLKFDRISYTSNIKVWTANTSYVKTEFDSDGRVSSGDIITHAALDGNVLVRKAYFVNANITTGGNFVATNYTVCPSAYFDNANDRIVGYYEPTSVMPVINRISTPITLANSAVDTNTIYVYSVSGMAKNMYITGQGVVSGYITDIVGNVTLMVNDKGYFVGNMIAGISSIENINDLSGLSVGMYVEAEGILFETAIAGINYTTNSVSLTNSASATVTFANVKFGGTPTKVSQIALSSSVTLDTNTTIYGRFDDLEQLVPGVTYPSSVTQSLEFKSTTKFGRSYDTAPYDPVQYNADGVAVLSSRSYDQTLYSLFANIALGTAPEDITTNGGKFVDTYHSRAPEELIPGITFDTLDLRVYTKINNDANIVAYRYFDNMINEPDYLRISGSNITKLVHPLEITDSDIYVSDASILYTPAPEYAQPGVVFINGERITYYKKTAYNPVAWVADTNYAIGEAISNDGNNYIVTGNVTANSWSHVDSANISYLVGTNVLSQLRRGTHGTGAPGAHPIGADVVDASVQQRIPGTVYGVMPTTANVLYNSGVGVALDGTGLTGSTTEGAIFLKAGELTSNVIPGVSYPIS